MRHDESQSKNEKQRGRSFGRGAGDPGICTRRHPDLAPCGRFVVWALWVFVPMAVFAYKRKQLRQTRRKKAEQVVPKREVYDYEAEQAEGVLLHHVSHRITAYLRSAYPGMTWDWCEKDPERIIRSGGSARIQLYGVPDFNYATVIFDTKANINCDMMRIVPLVEVQPGAGPKPAVEKSRRFPTLRFGMR